MSQDKNNELDFLDEMEGLTEQSDSPTTEKQKASFQTEKLEDRVLFSATWVDADTGEDLDTSNDDDNLFTGSSSNDVAYARDGNDILEGLEGDDRLYGQDGDDVLSGGEGNDRLIGGDGADQLSGGSGNDIIYADTQDTLIDGGDGSDRVIVQDDANFEIDTAATSIERVDAGSGDDTIDSSDSTTTVTQRGNTGDDNLIGGSERDYLYGGAGDDNIVGGDGNDVIQGNDGADQLFGGDGDDLIYADSEDTLIDGGEGFDRVIAVGEEDFSIDQAESSIERVDGASGDDSIDGSGLSQRALQYGNVGDDSLIGGSANDYQSGGVGDDQISGGDGNDTILGGLGADQLVGGAGNDTIYADAEDTLIDGGEGSDRVIVRNSGDFTIDQAATSIERVDGGSANDTIDASGLTTRAIQLGNDGDDILIGGSADDIQLGGEGNDTITGGDGNDRITGHEGADALSGEGGNDYIYADELDVVHYSGNHSDYEITDRGDGRFTIEDLRDGSPDGTDNVYNAKNLQFADGVATIGESTIDFEAGAVFAESEAYQYTDNVIDGDSGNNVLRGTSGRDIISGGEGDDNISGSGGADDLSGGDGDDLIYADADDTVDGGDGYDRVIVRSESDFSIDQAATSIERVSGHQGNDTFDASGLTSNANQSGGDGDDTLIGGSGNDYQAGGEGDDVLSGGAGNDRLIGGTDVDQLRGGDGDDTIYADGSDSVVEGGDGYDRVIVQSDQDFSIDQAAASVERVDGGTASDTLDASGLIADTIQLGNAGDDTLIGGEGDDRQYGGDGDDSILGGDGDDRIHAGFGDDVIEGGAGNDYIYGNQGNDTVTYDGNFTDYKVTYSNGRVTVEDLRDGSPDGRDFVHDVENIVFADGVASVADEFDFAHEAMDFTGVAIAENSPADTYVGEFNLGDKNFDYEIVDENGEVDNSTFKIVGNKIYVAESADINFEAGETTVLVRSTADDGDQYTESLQVQVTDVNEGPQANDDGQLSSFRFTESFNDGNFDGWEPISLGNDTYQWSVNDDGEVTEKSNSGRGFLGYDIGQDNPNAATASEYQITVDIDANTGNTYNNGVGIVFGYEDNQNYYQVSWNDYSDNYASNSNHKDFTLIKVENGVRTELDKIDHAELPNEFELGVSVSGNGGIEIEVDGQSMLTADSETPAVKTFGLFTRDNDLGVSYDNVSFEINSPLQTNEDTSFTFDSAGILANDVDEDGDQLTIKSVQDAQHGSVILNDDGTITFEPEEN